MSYEHGTTHYNLPQTVGSDTRDWFDTNEAFADIDAAIYSAGQTAETAKSDLTTVKQDIIDLQQADTAMTNRVDGIESRTGASEQAIGRLEGELSDDFQDLKDSICSIEEPSATAIYQHLKDTFFWYNDTLYKAIVNISIGQQIVPDTNCTTTNITTELLNGSASQVQIDDSSVSVSKVWSSSKTNTELNAKAPSADVYTKAQVYTKSEVDALLAQIGGGMKRVQRGTVTLTPPSGGKATATTTVTITSVDTSKSFALASVVEGPVVAAASDNIGPVAGCRLLSSTTLEVTVYGKSSENHEVAWQVVEFE